ncbi:MAG: aminotransferase class V-fold PLP-dependent enzyme [Clostridia bacterium]|nr:aminotransferase class V-fold PLP-dependent enzyme [Clostridia bacterium]
MIYFDNAATSFPKPSAVYSEISRCLDKYCGNPGRSDHKLSIDAARKIYSCREKLADLYGFSHPEAITFTYNATYALNMALKARIKKGCHVLISDIEHNAVLRPIHKLAEDGLISYSIYKSGSKEEVIDSINKLIRPNTSLIVANHYSNITSITLPIDTIADYAAAHGLKLICDASQSSGVYPYRLDTGKISALCAPAHKGLYGIQGVGFIINCDTLSGNTVIEGGGGTNSHDKAMPTFLPDRYEAGTANTPGIAALDTAVDFIKRITVEEIGHKENLLKNRFAEGLGSIKNIRIYGNVLESGGIVSFGHRYHAPSEIGRYLADNNICVRSGYHCSPLAHKTIGSGDGGSVRVSLGYFNTKAEIDKALSILSRYN